MSATALLEGFLPDSEANQEADEVLPDSEEGMKELADSIAEKLELETANGSVGTNGTCAEENSNGLNS